MDYSNIETFLAIADSRSMSAAADMLYISQSAVSQRLRALEDELGVTLVLRQKGFRNVQLTDMGEEFVPVAKQWRGLWQTTVHFKHATLDPVLTIAGPDSVTGCLLQPLLRKICGEMKLNVRTLPSEEIYRAMDREELDMGFVFHEARYKDIICHPLFREDIDMICRPGVYREDMVEPAALDPESEIYVYWGNSFQRWHDNWWSPSNPPRIQVENMSALLRLLDLQSAWAACPRSVSSAFHGQGDIEIHHFSQPPPARTCYLIEPRAPRQSRTDRMRVFRGFLTEYLNAQKLSLC